MALRKEGVPTRKRANNVYDYSNNFNMKITRIISKFLSKYVNIRGSIFLRQKISEYLLKNTIHNKKGICSTIHDVFLIIDPKDDIGHEIYYYGEYEPKTLWFLKNFIIEGDVFLDIGAYIGDISCIASKYVGKKGIVYAFEPVPHHYKTFLNNINLNNINNIIIYNIALSDKKGKSYIYIRDIDNRGADSLVQTNKDIKTNILVEIDTIDSLLKSKKILIPDILKIDVEGFELNVLKGSYKLLKEYAPILIVEYNEYIPQKEGKPKDILSYIKNIHDYKIYIIKPYKLNQFKLIPIMNDYNIPKYCNIYCLLQNHINKIKNKNIIL